MAFDITISDVKDGFQTGASDGDITGYIAIVSQADDCLTRNGVDEAIGKQLKVLAVRHMLTLAGTGSGSGQVQSERAVSGASRSYKVSESLRGTHYGDLLKQLDQTGCVLSIIESNANFNLMSIGRRPERNSTF